MDAKLLEKQYEEMNAKHNGCSFDWEPDFPNHTFDNVSNPSHYLEGRKYEPRKVISDWGLNFNLGNAVKYISRAGRKNDAIEDLKKAIQYIQFEIDELEERSQQHAGD